MKYLQECIKENIQIPKSDLEKVTACFQPRHLKKGAYFLKPETICREMAFIQSGYLRMFDLVDGKEITFWIGGSGTFITSLSSFGFESINYWTIQAVTESQLLVINRQNHLKLLTGAAKRRFNGG